MLTQFNCQSATLVKNAIVFYYIRVILHTLFITYHVCMCPCFVHFYYAKVALPELLEEPHQPVLNFSKGSFGQKKLVQYSFQGKCSSQLL